MPRKKTTEQENTAVQNDAVETKKTVMEDAATEPEEKIDADAVAETVSDEASADLKKETGNEETKEDSDAKTPEEHVTEEPPNEDVSYETVEPEMVVPEPVKEQKKLELGVLKIRLDEEEQEDDEFETLWNELVTYYRTRRILPVTVTGIERTQLAGNVVVTYYKDQRILVPMTEMMINLSEERGEGYTLSERLERVCNTMLGAEIDVMIKGMDKKNGSVVASRQDAMMRKREKFYLTPLSDGLPQVREGRIVEGRIIGVTQLVARVELFGVETTLAASELSWDWLPNVSDKFHVGDKLNVLIKEMKGDSVDNLRIVADVKSITTNVSMENLKKCQVQNKYIGEVTNMRNGVAYIRLKVGVNAMAHTNYDRRTPGKGDIVSFVITRINPEYGNVTGIITKIIKQSI